MNLKDLNNIDIKDLRNIDWSYVKGQLQSRPDLLINILLMIATFTVLISSYSKYTEMKHSSKAETEELQERLAAIEKFEAAKTQHNDFLKTAPKSITGDQLIQTLSEFAINRNVQILSFSPAQKKSNKLVSLTSVKVNVASTKYSDIILFVHDIEQSSYPIRIENWSGTSTTQDEISAQSSRRSSRWNTNTETGEDYIKATITIESVELNNV